MQIEYKNDQKMFRCLVRQRLIKANPEEEVRQRLLKTLIEDNKIPLEMLCVEERLDKYEDVNTNDRADIVIDHVIDETKTRHALILIECKSPGVPLTYKVIHQIERYNQHLEVSLFGMTNGLTTIWLMADEENGDYKQIEELPVYNEILKNKGFTFIKDTDYHPLNESNFSETPKFIRSFVANLHNLFNDTKASFPMLEDKGFKCIRDGRLRFESNGNAGGGSWDGNYRSVLVNTGESDNITISFCLFSGESVYLACAVDDNIRNHNSLQLSLNNWLQINKNKSEIWHDGTIAIGNFGSAKKMDLIAFVNNIYPELIVHEKVFLGELDNSKKFTFENEDVKTFISNLIKYLLCREKFRIEFRKQKESEEKGAPQ